MLETHSRPRSVVEAALAARDEAPASRERAHLADYSFRFDAGAAEPHAVPRPRGGAPWTLAQTLQEIRLRRASLSVTSRGLRLRHAHLLPDLAVAVRRHEPAVRLWLDLGLHAETPAEGWDDETALHAHWLRARFEPGREAVELRPGVSVTDWPQFVASVEDRLGAGAGAPCADSVRRDLADLFARHAVLEAAPFVGRAPARAA